MSIEEQEILSDIRKLVIEFQSVHPREYGRIRREFINLCNLYVYFHEGCSGDGDRSSDYYQVYENSDRLIAILYHPYELYRLRIFAYRVRKPILVYMFSLEDIPYGSIWDMPERVEVQIMPNELMKVYREIFT